MKLSFIAISAALVISLACCERRSASDTTITTAVKNKLAAEGGESGAGGTFNDAAILSSIKSQYVANGIIGTNVDVKNGEVTITGEVDNAREKARAEEIARQTSGVKSVRNQLP